MENSMSDPNRSDSISPHTPVDQMGNLDREVVEGHMLPSPAPSGHAGSPGGPSSVENETAATAGDPSRVEVSSPIVIPVVLPDDDADHPNGVSGPAGPSEEPYADDLIRRPLEKYSRTFTAGKGTKGGTIANPAGGLSTIAEAAEGKKPCSVVHPTNPNPANSQPANPHPAAAHPLPSHPA